MSLSIADDTFAAFYDTLSVRSSTRRSIRNKKPRRGAVFFMIDTYAASEPLSLFMAFFSSWRMRSAETLYLAASSCSVAFSSASQRW